MKNQKYALYARVSTSDGRQSNDNQKIRLKEFAESKGWDYELFEEQESTRKTRPVKARLLQRLRNEKFAGIAVVKLDRYARSSTELLLEVQELLDRGIEFHSITENLDFSTATGKLHFTILSAFAEFERDLIRQRTIEGLNRVKSQGKSLGRPIGSKDTKKRKTDGYKLREAKKLLSKANNTPPK
ncbi:resolvase [Marivirga tractuosa]|uniref:Resolvase domain n=1 Tax=Marivirga tractuosa (strain ATCC 23168 / DSM 4126 / NBRC 15989 / NCIMB 1408 / VKM B-1430 / H-43) TaxID=643867 RepID=E4TMW1_MARTH|nr:recombinase family protein [Marivirga tractuosa]ADR21392.1 Resolvase domain [Marivirga tractuosa DSM 4126]BDD14154.1 resolvase [Marivirga tractuosa]